MKQPVQLILLPGLGADGRLFGPQRSAFSNLIVPPWIPPTDNETLPAYASRLAETITATAPMVLGGVSFGGMVACEMAKHLQPDALVLIGTCRSPRGIRPICRMFRPLLPLLPARLFELSKVFAPLGLGVLGRGTPEHKELVIAMLGDTDARFIKWVCAAILNWTPGPPPEIPVRQIHGRHDQIIPSKRVDADEVIPGGGHLVNLTHAEQVNAFIGGPIEAVR